MLFSPLGEAASRFLELYQMSVCAPASIAKVEVSDDGGTTWRPAVLKRELSPVAWRLWATDISPGTGPRRVLVRATDGTGEVQTSAPADPHPSGASGYDFVTFQVL